MGERREADDGTVITAEDPDDPARSDRPVMVIDRASGEETTRQGDAQIDAVPSADAGSASLGIPASGAELATRRVIVRATTAPAARPDTRRRIPDRPQRPTPPPAVPRDAVVLATEPAAGPAPLLVTDLRLERIRPLGDRFLGWLASRYRAVVALGVGSLVHPVAIVGYAMLAGLLLRAFEIGTNPPGLNQDEAVAGYDGWSVWQTLRDHHGNTLPIAGFLSFGDWSSPFLYFFLTPIVGIFGLDITTIRAGTIVLGVAAIAFTYLLTVELTGRRGTGAAAACFLALSPWAVHLSRFAIPPATVVPLLTLSLWLVLRALRLRSTGSVVLAALALGLTITGYQTMKLYVPLAGLLIAALYLRSWLLLPVRSLIAGALALGLVAGPTLLFSFRDPDALNRQRFLSVFNRDDLGPRFFAEQYWSYVNPHYLFVNRNENDAADAASRFTTELSWTIPLLVVGGVAVLLRAFRPDLPFAARRPALLLAGLIVLAPVPGIFTTIQNGSREAQLIVLLAMVAGIGLVTLGDLVRRLLGHVGSAGFRAATVLLVLTIVLAPLGVQARDRYHGYFQDYPRDWSVQRYFHTGLIPAAEYAYEVQDDYDQIWFVDTNQGYVIFLIANHIDPSLVHNDLEVSGEDFGAYLVDGIGKFRFNGVYVGLDENIVVLNQRVVFESFPYGNGRGYVARSGESPDGRPILVVNSEVR